MCAGVKLPVTVTTPSSVLYRGSVCPQSASWLNENSMGTIGPLIDFVSSIRQKKTNPTLSFSPIHSKEGKPI